MLDARLDQLKEKGNQARRPISAHLEDGIFELRAKKARMLFYFGEVIVGKNNKQRAVIFIHSLFKDTRKIPREDINLAKKRRNEILTMGGKINALPN